MRLTVSPERVFASLQSSIEIKCNKKHGVKKLDDEVVQVEDTIDSEIAIIATEGAAETHESGEVESADVDKAELIGTPDSEEEAPVTGVQPAVEPVVSESNRGIEPVTSDGYLIPDDDEDDEDWDSDLEESESPTEEESKSQDDEYPMPDDDEDDEDDYPMPEDDEDDEDFESSDDEESEPQEIEVPVQEVVISKPSVTSPQKSDDYPMPDDEDEDDEYPMPDDEDDEDEEYPQPDEEDEDDEYPQPSEDEDEESLSAGDEDEAQEAGSVSQEAESPVSSGSPLNILESDDSEIPTPDELFQIPDFIPVSIEPEVPQMALQVATQTQPSIEKKQEDTGVVFTAGMTLMDFLRKNPKVRLEADVLKYFTKKELDLAKAKGEVLTRKGKLII